MLGAVGAVLFTFWYIYKKGKDAATAELETKSIKEAMDAIKNANNARNASAANSDRGGLYEDDGFRRD